MKKVVKDFSTEVYLEKEEAVNVCRLGQGEKCCAYLVVGHQGFECARMNYPISAQIHSRLEAGTMNAKGTGGWEGCAWETQLKEEQAQWN